MNIATLIRSMAAAGAPAEAIALAVEAIEDAQNEMNARRAAGAERVRRHRAAKAACNDDVTNGNVTVTPEPLSPAPPFPSPKPLTKTPLTPIPLTKSGKRARADFHRLPDDWEPGPLPASLAAEQSEWPPGWLDGQADRFRAWAANAADEDGKGRKLKWDQAFHNWLRDNANVIRKHGRNGSSAAQRLPVQPRLSPGVAGGMLALQILDEREAAWRRENPGYDPH